MGCHSQCYSIVASISRLFPSTHTKGGLSERERERERESLEIEANSIVGACCGCLPGVSEQPFPIIIIMIIIGSLDLRLIVRQDAIVT